VDVVAILPRQLLDHLRVVLGTEHVLTVVTAWGDLHNAIQQRIVDVVVADPLAAGMLEVDTLIQVRRDYPSLPMVVYTTVSPAAMIAVAKLGRWGVEHVVLSRFDDERGRFLGLIESIPAHVLAERMLRELGSSLSLLPVVVVRAIDQLFHAPGRFRSVQDLGAASGMSLRTLYRNLEPAGLHSARALVVSARLLRAYGYLQDPGRSIKDVASKTGYHSPWQLSQQMRELTGKTTERVRREVDSETMVVLLAAQIRRRRKHEGRRETQ
jgi:AraC-like DNA-binding protein